MSKNAFELHAEVRTDLGKGASRRLRRLDALVPAIIYGEGKEPVNISNSDLDSLVVTDTIPLSKEFTNCPRVRQLSLAKLLAESIRRVSNEESISAMFENT